MNESIYNLIPVEYSAMPKKPMYKPTQSSDHKIPNSTFGCHGSTRPLGAGVVSKKSGATFGPPRPEFGLTQSSYEAKDSSGRGGGDANTNGSTKYDGDERRPRVPGRFEKPIMGITTSKNYVTANAVEAILQAPKQTESAELNYMKKEDFGKIPAYLDSVKEEIRRENFMIERYLREQMGVIDKPPDVYEEMSEYDRSELIDALKAKWEVVNSKYQKITHLVLLDTTGQVRRKETYENILTQLDNDIQKLQKGSKILIKAD